MPRSRSASGEAAEIRVTPAAATLGPGQSVSLLVERKAADGDQWREVRPDTASWSVPSSLIWTPAAATLRPAVTVPNGAKGDMTLKVTVDGKDATATISAKDAAPDAKDAAAVLKGDREPGGWYIPVGQSARCIVSLEKSGNPEPAADVHWPGAFENDFVRWDPPVLTAKKDGYTVWLRADAGGRAVLFHATTYEPIGTPPDRGDVPQFVVILSDQGTVVRFPVGAIFGGTPAEFRVQAHYPDGYTRLVTKKATIRTSAKSASEAIVTPSNGRLIGVREGSTEVTAEFDGVHSSRSRQQGRFHRPGEPRGQAAQRGHGRQGRRRRQDRRHAGERHHHAGRAHQPEGDRLQGRQVDRRDHRPGEPRVGQRHAERGADERPLGHRRGPGAGEGHGPHRHHRLRAGPGHGDQLDQR